MALLLSHLILAIRAMLALREVNCARTRMETRGAKKQSITADTGTVPINYQQNQVLQTFPVGGSLKNRPPTAPHSDLPQEVHALIQKSPEEFYDYVEGDKRPDIARDRTCCCSPGRCSSNDIENGAQEKRFQNVKECCEFRYRSETDPDPGWFSRLWSTKKPREKPCHKEREEEACESLEEKEIKIEISQIGGASHDNASRELCHRQLHNLSKRIRVELDEHQEDFFHGTAIDKIHLSKAATDIMHRMIMPGKHAFDRGSVGAHLFDHTMYATLLWNGMEADDRSAWKKQLGAAELSRGRDVAFARIVDHADVGQLRACNISNLWFVASSSFAGVAPEKPLVLIIGKDEEQLEDTQFWRGELQGVVENPPMNGLAVISTGGFDCSGLMPKLTEAIETRIPPGTNGNYLKAKWKAISSYTCRNARAKMPNNHIGDTYRPPTYDGSIIDFLKPKLGLFFEQENIANLRATLAALRYIPREESTRFCEQIEHLNHFYLQPAFGDSEIQEIANHCPNLQTIELYETQVTDIGVKDIATNCPNLKVIGLAQTAVTDEGVKDIATNCPNLKVIKLAQTAVTDEGVKELSAHCTNLQRIYLSSTKVTDVGVKDIATNCPNLQAIWLTQTAVTDEGVKDIATNCPNLKVIGLAQTAVTDEGVKEASKIRPGATFYSDHGYYKNGEK